MHCTCHTSEPRPRRRLSAPQLLQNALRTACHTKTRRGHGGDYPRRSSFRKLCVLRLPHKSEPRPRRRLSAPQLLQIQEALRTAPATQKRAAATAATISALQLFQEVCVLRLPHKSEPRPRRRLSAPQPFREALRTAPATQKHAAATAATIRAAAPSGSSVYCACHTKASRGHGGDYPRRSSFRKLCVLRLPHKSTPRHSSFGKLCVPRLPHKSEPRPRRRLSAPQLLQEALRTAPATQKHAAATAATIRAAAPSGGSVYCARHAKASRGHGGDYPRRSSFRFRKLCVLHLPHKSEPRPRRRLSAPQLPQEALHTAPAKQHVCEMRCVR